MEDIGKIGVEEYHPSDYVQLSDFKMMFNFTLSACRIFYYGIVAIVSHILGFFSITSKDNSYPLVGKVALVTGAGNGFGRSLGIMLAAEGCHVAVVDIDGDAAEETAAKLRSMDVKSVAYKVDVSDSAQVEKLHDDVVEDLGVVDILVNNAAILPLMSFREGTPTDIERIVKTTRTFLGDMIKQKCGHIVAVCSGYGLYPGGRSVTYSASKFGVRGFMASLSEELMYNDHDFIKTTTIFPLLMSTRKEVSDLWVKLKMADRMMCLSPNYAAFHAVQAIKNRSELISLPKGLVTYMALSSLFPASLRKKVILQFMDGKIPQVHPNHC
ncbi:uncharacterized oxidoreductase YoxD-like isoform X1 [Lutzomyia longipalpis]|uniref:uncharacterized oxidoreductase YoxD-like isoform X1 n=1 Tax=Lutzomyia longipalpis TaxID=7200 RepID=UPI002483ECE8|nr:uncharacterized oxidoreductase YoxD-like isoform X1 [Lutzomyia longipalpis]